MADSTSLFQQLSSSQAGKEATVNELLNAVSPSAFGARKQSSSGLSWDYYGGRILVDGVSTAIASGTLTLTASTTNYVEATRAGVVSKNITGFTAGSIALYKVVTGTDTVTSYEDHRPWLRLAGGRLSLAMTDANTTLTHAQALNDILEFTGTLTAQRDIVLPLAVKSYTVRNATTGGFGLRFIGATGTGIVVANGTRMSIYADGTNILAPTTNLPGIIIGDPGSESAGIVIGGVTYESTFKVSDINGSNYAQTILHRHSTTLEPLIVGARSNSNNASHTDVTAGMGLFSIYGVGWLGSDYKIFGSQTFGADDTGTLSNTSSPGKWTLSLTPDGATAPAAVIIARNDKSVEFGGNRVRITTAKTPSSATDTGTAGDICWDASYVYVCTATDTWKRSAISTW